MLVLLLGIAYRVTVGTALEFARDHGTPVEIEVRTRGSISSVNMLRDIRAMYQSPEPLGDREQDQEAVTVTQSRAVHPQRYPGGS